MLIDDELLARAHRPSMLEDPDIASAGGRRNRVLLVADQAANPYATNVLAAHGVTCLVVAPTSPLLSRALSMEPDVVIAFCGGMTVPHLADILMRVRSRTDAAVILVGSQDRFATADERALLDIGFDSLWPPVTDPQLLAARILALLRQQARDVSAREARSRRLVIVGPLAVQDFPAIASYRTRPLALTKGQTLLLHAMASAPARTLPRAETASVPLLPSRALDTNICRLRQRLREQTQAEVDILAVRSVGYRLRVPPR